MARPSWFFPRIALVAGLIPGPGCASRGDGDPGTTDDGGTTLIRPGNPGGLQGLDLSAAERVPTVLTARWHTDSPGRSWVEYGLDGVIDHSTPAVEAAADGASEVVVLGLKAGRSYAVRAVTALDDGTTLRSDTWTVQVATRAVGLPTVRLTDDLPGQHATDDYFLVSLVDLKHSWIVLLDRDGDYVWWHDAGPDTQVITVRPSLDGQDVLFMPTFEAPWQDRAEVRRVSLRTGELLRSTRTPMGHHAFAELPNGLIAFLAYETAWAQFGPSSADITTDRLELVPEGSDETTPSSLLFDALTDWRAPAPGCDHTTEHHNTQGGLDWTHANSLIYDEAADQLLLNLRWQDTLLSLDATSGAVSWEMGPFSTDLLGPPDQVWSHPHLSDADQDTVVAFDNGDHHSTQASGVSVYSLDHAAGTWTRSFRYDDPEHRFIQVVGDARRMPDGDLLTSWTTAGTLQELSPQGVVTWAVGTELGYGTSRVIYVPDLYDLASGELGN